MTAPKELADFLARISSGRDGVPISIDEAQSVAGLGRAAVLERFRELQAGGEGYLKLGRHGHPTRFYFRSSSTSKPATRRPLDTSGEEGDVVAAALPQRDVIANARGADQAGLADHIYQLRADLRIRLQLPVDLTEREALRLARFIETLPF